MHLLESYDKYFQLNATLLYVLTIIMWSTAKCLAKINRNNGREIAGIYTCDISQLIEDMGWCIQPVLISEEEY